jgi:hypothetical protein
MNWIGMKWAYISDVDITVITLLQHVNFVWYWLGHRDDEGGKCE